MSSSDGGAALSLSLAWERTPHTIHHRHRRRVGPSSSSVLLVSACALLLWSPLLCSCATVVATWVHLAIDPSTAPTSGFCDQWVAADVSHERLLMVGGDDGDETGPQGTWALDYSASFTSPVWRNLTIDTSEAGSISSPYIGGGPQGELLSSPATLAQLYSPSRPELLVWGGHSLVSKDFFNAAYDSSLNNDTAVWVDDSDSTLAMPEVAWATTAWGNHNQTLLFMYGGTGNTTAPQQRSRHPNERTSSLALD